MAAKFVERPGDVVQELFRAAAATAVSRGGDDDDDEDFGVAAAFDAFLGGSPGAAAVPLLRASERGRYAAPNAAASASAAGSLVRVRCMVQDVFGTELFAATTSSSDGGGDGGPTKMKKTCRFGACFDGVPSTEAAAAVVAETADADGSVADSSPVAAVADRTVLACVGIPGESAWVADAAAEAAAAATAPSDLSSPRVQQQTMVSPRKRRLSSSFSSSEAEADRGEEEEKSKRPARAVEVEMDVDESTPPATNVSPPAFLVKTYGAGDDDCDVFRVGQAFEFAGILEPPALSAAAWFDEGCCDGFAESMRARNPPPSITPRIHAITFRRLESGNGHPDLLPPFCGTRGGRKGRGSSAQEAEAEAEAEAPSGVYAFPKAVGHVLCTAETVRRHVVGYFASVLGGDALAAEYLLLALVSRVAARKDAVVVGKFGLSMTGATPELVPLVAQAVASVCTKTCTLPLTVSSLNAGPLAPFKDYTHERLVQTPLQVTPGTVLLVDETRLEAGQLGAVGVGNVEALKELVRWQRMAVDFTFHKAEFLSDTPVVVLSRGRSLIDSAVDCVVPIVPSMPWAEPCVPAPLLSEAFLSSARLFVAVVRELAHTVDPAAASAIQSHFVSARQAAPGEVNEATLHRWMATARLVSLSHGEQALSLAAWNHTLALENARTERLRTTTQPQLSQ